MTETAYQHFGNYDHSVFQAELTRRLAKDSRFSSAALPDALVLLSLVERDIAIIDIRWAAYIFATVMWETTSPFTVSHSVRNKKGQPLRDKKGREVVVKRRKWLMTMAPVEEVGHGKGRRYHEPVKVKLLADGSARVTEQDGDQFKVSANGVVSRLTHGATMGTQDGAGSVKAYDNDDGSELVYFGRGYVQLTWWSNYASGGAAIGRGLDLLLDPELVKTPAIAYALLSLGMRTGKSFANGHRFRDYFSVASTDYVGARRMVNGQDCADDIADLAIEFEFMLRAASEKAAGPAAPASKSTPPSTSNSASGSLP